MMRKILLVCIVLLSMIMVIPGVLADTTGTAAVSGNPALTMSFTVTGSYSFGDMSLGDNANTTANTVKANVVTNAPWAISVSDGLTDLKPAASVGKMAEWDGASYSAGGKVLTDPLKLSQDGSTYITLSANQQQLFTGIAGITDNYPFFLQRIEAADTRVGIGHSYRVVVTFTLSTT